MSIKRGKAYYTNIFIKNCILLLKNSKCKIIKFLYFFDILRNKLSMIKAEIL